MAAERALVPRVVVVRRAAEYEQLLARHATRGQAAFFLQTRGESIEPVEERHQAFERARDDVLAAIPTRWRRIEVNRTDLDRFLFERDDLVIALGQDGRVANVAKYLGERQPVIGINPDRARYEGVLVRHEPGAAGDLLADAVGGRAAFEDRTLAEARLDDGQRIVALNEVFVGHSSHQSARYELQVGDLRERQSSSGLIAATGTGQTGWSRSIRHERGSALPIPAPTDAALTLFVREAWPSVETGADLTEALVTDEPVEITSLMDTGGRIFGDGIESDHLTFEWGAHAAVGVSDRRLRLVV